MEENKQDMEPREDYFSYGSNDLIICERLCDACVFRMKDAAVCRKYPEGKPEAMLDKDAWCTHFSVIERD